VAGEVGDENPRLALADARRDVGSGVPVISASAMPAASAPGRETRRRSLRAWRLVTSALAGH